MTTIEFDAPFGNKTKHVKLAANHFGGGGFQILIDNFYQGDIVFINKEWKLHLNAKSLIQGDDIALLVEKIEQSEH